MSYCNIVSIMKLFVTFDDIDLVVLQLLIYYDI